jgi:adhesin/invasin
MIAGASALLLGLLAAGCTGELVGGGQIPAKMLVVSGDLQTGTVGTELAQPLVVRVVDDRDRPVRNQLVNFVVTAGGGSVFAGSAITNADGEARERWTLGTVAGDTQRVEARAVDPTTGQALVFAVFRAVGTPAALASLTPWYNGTLGGAVSSLLADSIAVVVRDSYGNPVPGASVTWSAAAGTGTFSPATSVADGGGRAWTAWTLGPEAGKQVARATLPGSAVTADVPVNAGTQLRIVAGDYVLSLDGTVWEPPTVALYGTNPPVNGAIGDARVSWTVESGGGTVSAPFTRTGPAGFSASAQVGWTVGAAGTPQRLTARVGNLAVTFNAVRPLPGTLAAPANAGGRVLDTDGTRALVADSSGGTWSLRIRTLSTGADVPVGTTSQSPRTGALFSSAVLYTAGITVYEWRNGTTTTLATGNGVLYHKGDWAAWPSTAPMGYMRRNVATARTDTMFESTATLVGDVSAAGHVTFTRTSAGTRGHVWLANGTQQFVANGTTQMLLDGDVLHWHQPDAPMMAREIYTRTLSESMPTLLYKTPAGSFIPRLAARGGWVAWTEQGNNGCAFMRRSPSGTLSRFGRWPSGTSPCEAAVAPNGAAAYLYRTGLTVRLLLVPGPGEEVRDMGEVSTESRLLERGGRLYLVSGASIYTLT